MQISSLDTLVAVAQHNSFSRTADIRNMTLSAVSMQMKSLEEELGAELFDRRFRPPKLTPLGKRVAQDARTIVEAYALLRSRCLSTSELTGAYRIGFVPSASARILPRLLRVAAEHAPKAAFRATTALSETLCDQVRNGQLDAAVVTEIDDATVELACETLRQEEMVVAVPSSCAISGFADLDASLPFLQFAPTSGIGKLIARYRDRMHLTSKNVIVLDSIEAIVQCVRNGIGFALLPRPDVARYGGDQVQILPCRPQPLFRNLSLVTRDDALAAMWRPELKLLLEASLPEAELQDG